MHTHISAEVGYEALTCHAKNKIIAVRNKKSHMRGGPTIILGHLQHKTTHNSSTQFALGQNQYVASSSATPAALLFV